MKSIYILSLFIAAFTALNAQKANTVIFSEGGEKFTVYLNGEQKNDTPTSNVKIKDLTSEFYQCKIVFEDMTMGVVLLKNFALQFGMETTYVVKMTKKGQYALRYYTGTPIGEDRTAEETPRESVVIISEPAKETPTMEIREERSTHVPSKTTTTVTQTTTTTRPVQEENIKVTMDVPGVNMNINMNVSDPTLQMDVVETTTTTVTTTTQERDPKEQRPPVQNRPQPVKEETVIVSKNGCTSSMPSGDFNKVKSSIESKSFSDSKMTIAKQGIKGKCPTAGQIKDFCALFSFEADKLEFAKFAYDFAWDPENYFEVYEAFTFESSITELSEYIEKK